MFGKSKKQEAIIPSGAVTRHLHGRNWHIELDLTPQVLSLTIPPELRFLETEDVLAPTCEDISDGIASTGFVSASMLALKAKLFDDSLYAAAELALQPAKAKLLAQLVDVAPLITAAAWLGGLDVAVSPEVERITQAFLDDELASKPMGFYTWSDDLRCIFQQDRLLQKKLEKRDVQALIAALEAEPKAKAAYLAHIEIVTRLTNPVDSETPELFKPAGRFFFPPSRSHETDLARRLFAAAAIPDGFSLADEVVERIRDGSIKVDPTEKSGWYDFQTWALEALAAPDRMPEADRLNMDDSYREHLEDLFKATLALTRETHVKQLMVFGSRALWGDPEQKLVVRISPDLSVEPLRSYYQRRADGYAFIRRVLDAIGPVRSMHAVSETGPSVRTLDEDLEDMTALFLGAAAVVGDELGMEPASGTPVARFREWAIKPDVVGDVRMMVPIFYDIERGKTKVWAILGWAARSLQVSFATPPNAHIRKGSPRIAWDEKGVRIPYPVFAETYVSRLLDRNEFRAHCDRYKTAEAILAHLS